MPIDANAATIVSAFDDVPRFAQGQVRDIRVRWACEEIGRPYRPELIHARADKPEGYRRWQPFGQVPAFADDRVRIFESGAILLYLAERDERLLPSEPADRWNAITWLIAALNSVEPSIMQVVWTGVFNKGKDWVEPAMPAVIDFAKTRLKSLSDALGDKDWLIGRFTVADIMMVTVLRALRHTQILEEFPNLAAYRARGETRPAFVQALADQIAGFDIPESQGVQ